MLISLFERGVLMRDVRLLSAVLLLVSGVTVLLQAYFIRYLPPEDGFLETSATVVTLDQTGSFQYPNFMAMLTYEIPGTTGTPQQVRSGQLIDFEQYFRLSVGQTITIHYNPQNVVQWRIEPSQSDLGQYSLGFLMVSLGGLIFIFPMLASWASRRDDFEFDQHHHDKEDVLELIATDYGYNQSNTER
ncbi:MAG: hypothetical protein ACFE0Q_15925 [Anaerolineae bacterium]